MMYVIGGVLLTAIILTIIKHAPPPKGPPGTFYE